MNRLRLKRGLSYSVSSAYDYKLTKKSIIPIVKNFNDYFGCSISSSISSLKNKIQMIDEEIYNISQALNYIVDENGTPCEKDINIYNQMGSKYNDIIVLNQQLQSIEEMRIINLYKNTEILLKLMITTAFPKQNLSDLHRWNNMKNFFKTKGIIMNKIAKFKYIDQIRIINNNIKHGLGLSKETKKIYEFREKDNFDAEVLEKFFFRIKDYPLAFLNDIAIKLEKIG